MKLNDQIEKFRAMGLQPEILRMHRHVVLRITDPADPARTKRLVMPASPGDHRGHLNLMSLVRRWLAGQD